MNGGYTLIKCSSVWHKIFDEKQIINTYTPVIRSGVYPYVPIAVTGPFVTPGSRLTGALPTGVYTI